MGDRLTGTVTFLFTDIEGSTRLWEEHSDEMKEALARHDELLKTAVEAHRGQVLKNTGDGLLAVFGAARDGIAAAVEAQRGLDRESWGALGALRVRMGLHTGEAQERDGDYYGSALNRAARLMSAAHGGQIVCSQTTVDLARDELVADLAFIDLGEHRLRDLAAPLHVFQVRPPDLRSEFPPLRSLDALPGNLPRQLTSFVGREEELATVAGVVRERPLVTLTGVGGVGKTRLALQVAADVLPDFADGAWLCELAPVTDPGAVWDTLAAALAIVPSPGRAVAESIVEMLEARELLLVLDNCEHLLHSVAQVVDAILRRCANVHVIATSREGLALAGEHIVAVPSLDIPPPDADTDVLMSAESVRLFLDRAQDVRPDFALGPSNAATIAQLCRRLDGIPLAIELAAARVRSLSPEDLVTRLDQRFKLLTKGSRAALERHQTLRNTIEWSYDLLNAVEQAALSRASVFAGSFDLAAAEVVLSAHDLEVFDVADVLGQLVDKSLVVVDDMTTSQGRYRLLETIRQYAQERLEASDLAAATRERHADHYVGRAEEAGPRLRSREQLACAEEVARDADNFRAALDWAVETGSPEHALRLVAPLTVTGVTVGYAAMDWAETAVEIDGASGHALFPEVAAWAAWGATMRGEFERARDLVVRADHAERSLGTTSPSVRRGAATLAFFTGDVEAGRQAAEEWVRRARAADDAYETAHALTMLAGVLGFTDPKACLPHVAEAIQVARDAGIASALTVGLTMLAGFLTDEPDERVEPLLDEAVDAAVAIGDRQMASQVPFMRGWRAAARHDWAGATHCALDAAEQKLALGDFAMIVGCYAMAAIALARLGRVEPASVFLGARDRMSLTHVPEQIRDWLQSAEATLLEEVGGEQLRSLRSRGAEMSHRELVAVLRKEVEALDALD